MTADSTAAGASDIAIVGMACRLPGASTPAMFWRNLRDAVESVRPLSDAELRRNGVPAASLAAPNYVKSAALLEGVDLFDPAFFGFSAREAGILDPQHRHFLECAWEALEDAGHVPERFPGSIGVFAGCGMNAYFMFNLLTNPDLVRSVGLFLLRHTGNDKDFLTTRVSYCLNLTGPSVGIQTACSTSLVAVHTACQSLLLGECDLALAGGVTIEIPHGHGYFYEEGEILSPDGHCRAFDAESKGTVFGSGAGVVVLRRLQDAIDAGDRIRAVIRGSAVNNDGSTKVGYLAPSVDGQAKAVREALSVAAVPARSVTCIETHGTGTPVGDPIEIAALTQAFARDTSDTGFCAIGSVKTNIGHLDTAAGVAGLIKVVLALEHQQIPASLNFTAPNPAIEFGSTPFVVNTALTPWPRGPWPRRAAVNALGVGGTNAHVIVEEAPARQVSPDDDRAVVLLLSARSRTALDAAADRLADHLERTPDLSPVDAAYTLQVGRRRFDHRRFVIGRDRASLVAALRAPAADAAPAPPASAQGVVFLFPGGGAQFPGMGAALYHREPVYREHIDRGLAWVRERLRRDLAPCLFPPAGTEQAAAAELERASNSILAVFLTEVALARLWMSWGLVPVAMTGHSLGEYTAAHVAGALSFEDALSIVAVRGELFDRLPPGAMLSVPLDEPNLRRRLPPALAIAAVNAPDLCVVSGPVADVDEFERRLVAERVEARRLHIQVAAHSAMLDPVLDEFRERIASVGVNPAAVPFISNTTGTWVESDALRSADYWVRHLRQPVRFADGLGALAGRFADAVWLEVGPGQTLTTLARLHPRAVSVPALIPSMRQARDETTDDEAMAAAVGQLWTHGQELDWERVQRAGRRVGLPTYAFDHESYWIRPGAGLTPETTTAAPEPAVVSRIDDVNRWASTPGWRPAPLPSPDRRRDSWLVFEDPAAPTGLPLELRQRGQTVVTVVPGEGFRAIDASTFSVAPGVVDDLTALLGTLESARMLPDRVLHTWCSLPRRDARPEQARVDTVARGADTLVALAQVLGAGDDAPVSIDVVTAGLEQVSGEPSLDPLRATLLGPVLVIPREYPHLACRHIDVAAPVSRAGLPDGALLVDLLLARDAEPRSALRDGKRWVPAFTALEMPPLDAATFPGEGRTYLITGGLSGIGLEVAARMAGAARVNLVLVSRRPLPADAASAAPGDREWASHARALVSRMEAAGAGVLTVSADVTSPDDVGRAVRMARDRFGRLDGVLHCAGLIDDAPIQVKDPAAMARVMAPKVDGVLALDAVLAGDPVDLMILFSSTSAFLGLAGQVDYTSANAFLNAYARSRQGVAAKRVIAIEWGVWRDVGIAARAAGTAGVAAGAADAADDVAGQVHPLLGRLVTSQPARVVFESALRVGSHWILGEHRLANGQALLPGTGYIEMVRAALAAIEGPGPVEISDVYLIVSLEVAEQETRPVRTTLERDGEGWTWTVTSRSDSEWIEHARGRVRRLDAEAAPAPAVDAASGRVARFHAEGHPTRQERHLRFGPRWKNLHEVRYDHGTAVGELKLPEPFADDLPVWSLHPALFDQATAIGLPLVDGYDERDDLYVPLSYQRIRIFAPLTPELRSVVTLGAGSADIPESVECDAVLLSPDGRRLVDVEGFLMRRASTRDLATRPRRGTAPAAGADPGRDRLAALVAAGIDADHGWEALRRVATTDSVTDVVVSSIDLASLAPPPPIRERRPAAGRARPAAPASAATDDIERTIAGVWSELLGVDDVGLDDDFFELGGHSLIAVRLIARLEKLFQKKMKLGTLFEARTVRALAEIVGNRRATSSWVSLVPIQPRGDKPPFFCVHGVGGEVLSYSSLAARLPPDQPFIGVRSRGHDGVEEPLQTIEEQAALYVAEMVAYHPDGPYYLGGYSHGGRVALEMALQLQAQGRPVAFLGIIDTWPFDYHGRGVVYSARWLANLPRWLWYELRESDLKANVSRARRAAAVIGRRLGPVRRSAGPDIADVVDVSELPAHVQRLFQANFAAFRAYKPRGRYRGTLTLFRATGQPLFSVHDPDLGWGQVTDGRVVVRPVPGNHTSLLSEPRVARLAAELIAALEEAGRPAPR